MRRLIIIALLACMTCPAQIVGRHRKIFPAAGGGPSFVGSTKDNPTGTATSTTTPGTLTIGTGDLVVVIFAAGASTALNTHITSVTCGTNTLTLGGEETASSDSYDVVFYYKVNATAGTTSCNVATNTTYNYRAVAAANWSGVGTTATLFGWSCGNSSCTTGGNAASSQNRTVATNISPTGTHILLLGMGVDWDGGATYNATTNSYTMRISAAGVSTSTPFVADRYVTAGGTFPSGNFASTTSAAQSNLSLFGAFTW